MKIKEKVLKSEVEANVSIYGTVEFKSKNFKLTKKGYLRLWINRWNIVNIEDWETDEETLVFRGDVVQFPQALLERFNKEGFVDLAKELSEIQDTNIDSIQKQNIDRLKEVYNTPVIYFKTDFTKEENYLVDMRQILNQFDVETYRTTKKYCNSNFGFSFEDQELEETVSLKEFTERYNLLKKKHGSNISELLKKIEK